jgi:ArsR family transcriptional regulator
MGILRVLKAESFSVSELCDLFSMRQSALSHHLKILAEVNLLSRRPEGTATFYRRQLPEGPHKSLRQTMFDDIDQQPLGHDPGAGPAKGATPARGALGDLFS